MKYLSSLTEIRKQNIIRTLSQSCIKKTKQTKETQTKEQKQIKSSKHKVSMTLIRQDTTFRKPQLSVGNMALSLNQYLCKLSTETFRITNIH